MKFPKEWIDCGSNEEFFRRRAEIETEEVHDTCRDTVP